MRPGLWAAALVLVSLALRTDAQSSLVGDCRGSSFPTSRPELRKLGEACAALSARTHASGPALTAAAAFIKLEDYARARAILAPFEAADDAQVLHQLAFLDSREGAKDRSIERYRRAVDLARRWKDPESGVLAATALGYELLQANRFEEAIRVLDPLRSLPFDVSRLPRAYVVRALFRLGDVSAAEAEFQQLDILRRDQRPTLIELLTEGQLRLERGQLRSAEQLLQRCREGAVTLGNRYLAVSALTNLVDVALAERDWKRARALASAAAQAGSLQPEDVRDLTYRDAIAARELGQLDESLALFTRALALPPDPSKRWRIQNELGKTLERVGRPANAVQAYQRSIAEIEILRSALADSGLQGWLTESRREPYLALFELHARAGAQQDALSALERYLGTTFSEQVASSSELVAREPLQALERQAVLRDVVRSELNLRGAEAPLQLGRAPFVAIVEGRQAPWRVVHTGARTTTERLTTSATEICARALEFSQAPDDDGLAATLGELLLGAQLPSALGERFTLVLPRCARNLPFAALRVGGRRLVELAVVATAPDLATASRKRVSVRDGGMDLVMGDPRGDLPAARSEALSVGRQLGVQALVGSAASSEALTRAPPLQLLHLATHTRAEARGPALVLSDRSFSVGDILASRLHPGLVVLASCHSGSTAEASARDTLASAFLQAGSQSVLATLRSVEDALTARVIEGFYRAGGLTDPAAALALVQRALSHAEPPSRWAVFFIAGSAEPLPGRMQVSSKSR